jgi:hypothetical protein
MNIHLATTDHHLSALHVDALWKHPHERKVHMTECPYPCRKSMSSAGWVVVAQHRNENYTPPEGSRINTGKPHSLSLQVL